MAILFSIKALKIFLGQNYELFKSVVHRLFRAKEENIFEIV